MSKRYYICAVIGDGSEENPFRPKVADYGINWSGSVVTDDNPQSPRYGKPLFPECLVIVATQNHAPLRLGVGIDPLPEFPLDGKVSSINTLTKNAMIAALQKRGFDTSGVSNIDGYRDLVQSIGRQRDPAFNIDNFDVAE